MFELNLLGRLLYDSINLNININMKSGFQGEYRVKYVIATQQCNVNPNSSLRFNFFLFKTSRTTTELRGNITLNNITFDDSLLVIHITFFDILKGM